MLWRFAVIAVLLLETACGSTSGNSGPGSPYLHINEVGPSNHITCADETGAFPDWIELYNSSTTGINLENYAITDDTDPITDAERLSDTLVVPADGVLVVWADHRPDLGPTHLPFKLKAAGEKVLLYGPDKVLLDRFDYSTALADQSFARFPDGTGTFVVCDVPTCDKKNGSACGTQ